MGAHRRSIEIDGAGHASAPIPSACLVGNILISSAINGKDSDLGKLPETSEGQIEHAFKNMDSIIKNAGADHGDVAKLTIYLASDDLRQAINKQWLARFPNAEDRPARHIIIQNLSHGMVIQIEVLAVLKGK